MTLLVILQTRQWYHLKELGIQLQKHPQHVKIDKLRPEKIEFKDYKSKLKMYVFGIWASDNESWELRQALRQASVSQQYRTGPVWEAAAGQVGPPAVGLASLKPERATRISSLSPEIPRRVAMSRAHSRPRCVVRQRSVTMITRSTFIAPTAPTLPPWTCSRMTWSPISSRSLWNGKSSSFLLQKQWGAQHQDPPGAGQLGKEEWHPKKSVWLNAQACCSSVGDRRRLNQIAGPE